MGGLYSKHTNGEAFRGSLADKPYLQLVQCWTIDDQIIVNQISRAKQKIKHFMLTNVFTKSLGGAAGASINDAEELAAQAIEMIVHKKAEEGDLDAIPQSPTALLEEAKEKGMLDGQGSSSGSEQNTTQGQ